MPKPSKTCPLYMDALKTFKHKLAYSKLQYEEYDNLYKVKKVRLAPTTLHIPRNMGFKTKNAASGAYQRR